jgi:hypothetical protein
MLAVWGERGIIKILKLTDGQFENSKIKSKNSKLWNPEYVGITIFTLFIICVISYIGFSAINRSV